MSLFKVTITKTAEVYVEAQTGLFAEEKVQRIANDDDVYLEWQDDEIMCERADISDWVESLDSGYYITEVFFNGESHLILGKVEDLDEFNENDECTDLLWDNDEEKELHVRTDVYIVGSPCCPEYTYDHEDPAWDIVNDNLDELMRYAELDSTNEFTVPNPYYEGEDELEMDDENPDVKS